MPKITTTMQPSKEIEVSDAEARNLRLLGVLSTVDGKDVTKKDKKPSAPRASGGSGETKKEG